MSYRNIQIFFFGFLVPLTLIIFGVEVPKLAETLFFAGEDGVIEFNASDHHIAVVHKDGCNTEDLAKALAPMAEYKDADNLLVNSDRGHADWKTWMLEIVEKTKPDHKLQAVVGVFACPVGGEPVAGLFFVNNARTSLKAKMAIQMEVMNRAFAYTYNKVEKVPLKVDKLRWPGEHRSNGFGLLSIIVICLGFSFYGPVLGLFVANERLKGVKFQQIVSGLRVETYWFGTLLMDYIIFCLLALLSYAYMAIADSKYIPKGPFFAMIFAFSLGNISLTYVISRFTPSPMSTFWIALTLNAVPGIVGAVNGHTELILEMIKLNIMQNHKVGGSTYKTLNIVLSPFPAYHFFKGCFHVYVKVNSETFLSNGAQFVYLPQFDELIAKRKWYSLLMGAVYLVLILVIDFIWFNMLNRRAPPKVTDEQLITDAEAVPVLQGDHGTRLLQIQGLRKTFGSVRAVNGLSFETNAGEVFGLLGTNSAGKTTAIKIAVGELRPDSGHVYMDGMHVHSNLEDVREKFGYCAQHDALFEELTVMEHLRFYAAIKGIPQEDANAEINRVVNVLGLTSFVNTRGARLSGGNKRKLSLAMAVIGGPAVLFLDEPSSGMDPLSQRFMWGIIKRLANARRTIVLTTHSMEEAEAVSNRVGIMMAGQFKCIGTLQEIKSAYGRGFEIVVQAAAPRAVDLDAIRSRLAQNYGLKLEGDDASVPHEVCIRICRDKSAGLQEEFVQEFPSESNEIVANVFVEWLAENEAGDAVNNFLKAKLVNENLTRVESLGLVQKFLLTRISNLASIFHCLEEAKSQGLSGEYSLTQFSLEQIFNNFAKEDADLRMVKDFVENDSD